MATLLTFNIYTGGRGRRVKVKSLTKYDDDDGDDDDDDDCGDDDDVNDNYDLYRGQSFNLAFSAKEFPSVSVNDDGDNSSVMQCMMRMTTNMHNVDC